jgi:hypothetical protein
MEFNGCGLPGLFLVRFIPVTPGCVCVFCVWQKCKPKCFNNMPSESSSKSANGSNTFAAAEALKDRGFVFTIPKSLPIPRELQFHVEWVKFAEAARGVSRSRDSAVTVLEAKKLFMEVFTAKYAKEDHFRKALFAALENSLGQLIDSDSGATGVARKQHASGAPLHPSKKTTSVAARTHFQLRGSCVGFYIVVPRDKLKFSKSYGMGQGSEPDITCVMIDAGGVVDTLAAVELKLHDTSCKEFVPKRSLDLSKDHAPVGQALIYTQDTWHAIARRGGISPEDAASTTLLDVVINDSISLPVVGLAAIRKSKQEDAEKQHKAEDCTGRLCCFENSLEIPKKLGEEFRYTLRRFVKFPPAGASDDVVERSYLLIPESPGNPYPQTHARHSIHTRRITPIIS